jgi:hypothetical protein
MARTIGLLCACALMASPTAAATLVTWEGTGEVTSVFGLPLGTPIWSIRRTARGT